MMTLYDIRLQRRSNPGIMGLEAIVMKNKVISLYKYTNLINGKAYIGVTNNLKRRAKQHKDGRSGAGAFGAAITKYGYKNFYLQELARFDSFDAARYHERAAIAAFKTIKPLGYNTEAAEHYRGPHSDDTKEKISAAHKRLGKHMSAELRAKLSARNKGNKYHLGHPHTAESNAKQSAMRKGIPLPKKHAANIAKSLIGNTYRLGTTDDAETRAKKSAAAIGKPKSAQARANMSAAQKGHKVSAEARAKIGAAGKGRRKSAETRAKVSAALKGHKTSAATKAKIGAANRGHHRPWSPARRAAYNKMKSGKP